MSDQRLLPGGIYVLKQYIGNHFKYIGLGNGSWGTEEKIPATITKLKREVCRKETKFTIGDDGKIYIYAEFKGSDLKYTSEGTTIYKLTEIGLFDTNVEKADQKPLLVKVFQPITMQPDDLKIIKIVIQVTP